MSPSTRDNGGDVVMKPGNRRKLTNRPSKRMLVRWNDTLDQQLLLTVQWACAEKGIKIPWKEVATFMGPKFTEGAIVQHLAKLRSRLEAVSEPVPPPLKRGIVAKEPSVVYATVKKAKPPPKIPGNTAVSEQSKAYGREPRNAKTRGKGKKRSISSSDEEEDESIGEELYDSDDDFSMKKKSRPTKTGRYENNDIEARKVSRKPLVKSVADLNERYTRTDMSRMISPDLGDSEDIAESIELDYEGPAYHTRGVRKDYKGLDHNDLDEGVESDDVAEEARHADHVKVEVVEATQEGKKATTKVRVSDRQGANGADVSQPASPTSIKPSETHSFPRTTFANVALPDTRFDNIEKTNNSVMLAPGDTPNWNQLPYPAYPMPSPVDFNGFLFHSHNPSFASSRTGSMVSNLPLLNMQAPFNDLFQGATGNQASNITNNLNPPFGLNSAVEMSWANMTLSPWEANQSSNNEATWSGNFDSLSTNEFAEVDGYEPLKFD